MTETDATRLTDEDLVSSFGLMLEATTKVRSRLAVHLEKRGLPGPYFDVLLHLIRAPQHRLPMTHLAHKLDYTGGGMTRLADRMEADGLLRRAPDPDDRRFVYAVLTDSGRERMETAWPSHTVELTKLMSRALRPEQVADLTVLARTVIDASPPRVPTR